MQALTDQLDPVAFHRDRVPDLLARHASIAGHAARGLPPLVLQIGDHAWTHRVVDGLLEVSAGHTDDGITVRVLPHAWSDYVGDLLTVPGLLLTQSVEVAPEDTLTLSHWDRGLRALYSGIPAYDPAAVALDDASGNPVDPRRSFTLADDDTAIAAHLATIGFVRVRAVFTPDEVADLNAEVDELVAAAREDDDRTWWSDQPDGQRVLNRVIYAHERSARIADLTTDARMVRLGRIHRDDLIIARDRMDGPSVLIKPAGELHGLANIPWHQDCGMGGHSLMCPAVGIGIQLTGADAQQSQFVGIAGSHGMTAHPLLTEEDLARMPLVPVDTNPGDVTLHITDVIHASPPPAGDGGRRTLYLTAFPPDLYDVVGSGESFNDMVRGRTIGAEDLTG